MRKILFFTHKPISHLFPISDLLAYLVRKGNSVYCLGYKEREEFFVSRGVKFIEYPKEVNKNIDTLINELEEKEYNSYKKNNFVLGYQYYLEKNAIYMHFLSDNVIDSLSSIVMEINPHLVFHDIVDLYAPIICNRCSIKRIDYITNPLYSKYYFDKDPKDLYAILTRSIHFDKKMKNKYINNYWNNLQQIYNKIEQKYGFISIPPLNQFEMNGDKNLIFNIECLQPPLDENDYILIPPSRSQFTIENNVAESLKNFIKQKENIMYVAQGSFLSENEDFYIELFKKLRNVDVNFVISCGKSKAIIKKVVEEMRIKDKVYFSSFIPQKYVLSKVNIFFSAGGFNSILEAIYYEVPLIINPISAEQRMNGYWTSKLGISKTLYSEDINFNLEKITHELLNDQKYKQNMKTVNKELKDSIEKREKIIENIL
ncbi:MAG: glycosyltransferase [Eggerthia catenaformis]|uniref:glycosyltransferase n=1 Tax=Eggerthia catenaformis TaxID=31973 RepID=UPI003FA12E03